MAFRQGFMIAVAQNASGGPEFTSGPMEPVAVSYIGEPSPIGTWVVATMVVSGGTVGVDHLAKVFPVSGNGRNGQIGFSVVELRKLTAGSFNAIVNSFLSGVGVLTITLSGGQVILVQLRSLVSAQYDYSQSDNTANPGVDPNCNFGTDNPKDYAAVFAPNRYRLPVVTWTTSILPTGVPATPVTAGMVRLRITRTFTTLSEGNANVPPYGVDSDAMVTVALL